MDSTKDKKIFDKGMDIEGVLNNPQLLRLKCAMVLYELERALGDFVRGEVRSIDDISEKSIAMIRERELGKKGEFDDNCPEKIIAATYIDEIFHIAENSAKGRPEEKILPSSRNFLMPWTYLAFEML